MANQKYTDENPALTAVVTGAVNGGDTINYTLLPLKFSNVGDYPIAVTLDNPNYTVVSTNGILSVTPKYCCNSNSDGKSKVYGMKILRLLLWLVAMAAVNSYPSNYCHSIL
jgi:hypothetical protein